MKKETGGSKTSVEVQTGDGEHHWEGERQNPESSILTLDRGAAVDGRSCFPELQDETLERMVVSATQNAM